MTIERGNGTEWGDLQQWLLEDYDARIREITLRIEQRQQLVNYTLVAIAGMAAAVGYIGSAGSRLGGWVSTLAFVASGFFLLFALGYIKHDLQVAINASYIEFEIRPLLTRLGGLPDSVLGWERYINAQRVFLRPTWWLHALLEAVYPLLMLIPFAACFAYGMVSLISYRAECLRSDESALKIWLPVTLALASVVFVGFIVTMIGGVAVVQAQQKINRSSSLLAAVPSLEKRVAQLEKRVDGLELPHSEPGAGGGELDD